MKVVLALEKIADKLVDLVNKGVNDLTVGKPEVCCRPNASTRHHDLHCDCASCDCGCMSRDCDCVSRDWVSCDSDSCGCDCVSYVVAALLYVSCGRSVYCSTPARSSTS